MGWLKVRFYGFLVPFSNNKDFSLAIILHHSLLTQQSAAKSMMSPDTILSHCHRSHKSLNSWMESSE